MDPAGSPHRLACISGRSRQRTGETGGPSRRLEKGPCDSQWIRPRTSQPVQDTGRHKRLNSAQTTQRRQLRRQLPACSLRCIKQPHPSSLQTLPSTTQINFHQSKSKHSVFKTNTPHQPNSLSNNPHTINMSGCECNGASSACSCGTSCSLPSFSRLKS